MVNFDEDIEKAKEDLKAPSVVQEEPGKGDVY